MQTLSLLVAVSGALGTLSLASPIRSALTPETNTVLAGENLAHTTLEGFHLSTSKDKERLTVNFSGSSTAKNGGKIPRFQLRYLPEEKFATAEGTLAFAKPPRFVLTLRSLNGNKTNPAMLQAAITRSRLVKEILVYPPVEEGDTAVEILLHDNVRFSTDRQGLKAGRLTLELRPLQSEKF